MNSQSDNNSGHETKAAAPSSRPPALELPQLLELPDVSWPPARHLARLPRVALEDVTAAPEAAEADLVSPATNVHSRRFRVDRRHALAATELPWHERPAVRLWIAKLSSGGIIALVVLALAGMFTRPWRNSHPHSKTAAPPGAAANDLQPHAAEPLIRQAQREPAPEKKETPQPSGLTEQKSAPPSRVAPPAVPVVRQPAPQLQPSGSPAEAAPPSKPSSPVIWPTAPVRLPSIDTELNAPTNGREREAAPHWRASEENTNGSPAAAAAESGFERTARLRGIIEPQPSRLR